MATHLVGSLVAKNELTRYLEPCIRSLQTFCDEIVVMDDGSTDGSREWLLEQERVTVRTNDGPSLFEHEGRGRQRLLEHTIAAKPSHILAVDCDELVSDGDAVRAACETNGRVFTLAIEEVWKADERSLWTRQDGGWRAHEIPILYRAPSRAGGEWRIDDKQLACGREPLAVRRIARVARGGDATGASVLHFGWACEADRQARYDRYVVADGGRFHASQHLRSIMFPDRRVRLARRPWPAALDPYRDGLLARVNPPVAA